MKLKFSLLIAILITIQSMAQNGFNYKAIIKDGSGNLITNDLIVVQFSILQGAAQTNVYQETHTPSTDANGMIIINIGEGTTSSGDFSTINWGADTHFLNTQINTGSGFVDMGTTQFKSTPYAKNSLKSETAIIAENVKGLEAIDEGNGFGWRLIGKDSNNYGDLGNGALDLSESSSASSTIGATGSYSLATGVFTTASGFSSTAIGYSTNALGYAATAMGYITKAQGNFSTAIGQNTNAEAMTSTSMGRYNIGGGDATNWVETDPLFEIGNGINNTNRSNALTILKNGSITAPTFDISEITDDKALITKEYADANLLSNGLEVINENGAIGWRLIGSNPNSFGDTGEHAISLTYSDGTSSTTGATGSYSLATGTYTTASGFSSTAIGYATTSAGNYATAIGYGTRASGLYTSALGQNTYANAMNSTAMGRYNIGGGNTTSWVATDPLFEIGNGTNNDNRSNALTILKNGTITAPGFDISEITDNKALITKEYVEANFIDVIPAIDINDLPAIGINDLTDGKVSNRQLFLGYGSGDNSTNTGSFGYNVGVGPYALRWNYRGINNTALGVNTLFNNSDGDNNVSVGTNSLVSNERGSDNVGIGYQSLYSVINGGDNTAVGAYSLYTTNGSKNSAFGRSALSSVTLGSNNTAIGYNAQVPSATGSNQVRIGNTNVTYAGVQVAWTVTSDRRWKDQIRELPCGLDMVLQLKPVDYIRKNNELKTREIGFIAQDVEVLLNKIGYNDQGILSKDDEGNLSLRYNDFIPLLTKALQEQQEIIESQQKEIGQLTSEISENKEVNSKMFEALLERVSQLESQNNL